MPSNKRKSSVSQGKEQSLGAEPQGIEPMHELLVTQKLQYLQLAIFTHAMQYMCLLIHCTKQYIWFHLVQNHCCFQEAISVEDLRMKTRGM